MNHIMNYDLYSVVACLFNKSNVRVCAFVQHLTGLRSFSWIHSLHLYEGSNREQRDRFVSPGRQKDHLTQLVIMCFDLSHVTLILLSFLWIFLFYIHLISRKNRLIALQFNVRSECKLSIFSCKTAALNFM